MAKRKEPVWEATKSVAANGRLVLPRLNGKYLRAGKKLMNRELSPKALHNFGLKTKRFSDTLELFRPYYGARLERQLETLRRLQQYLGAVNDCKTTRRLVLGKRQPRAGQLARLAKFLDARVSENTALLSRDLRGNLHGDTRKAWWVGYLTTARPRAAKTKRTPSRQAPRVSPKTTRASVGVAEPPGPLSRQ